MGHIRIVGTLGVGGMGEVYVGWDETLERRVALKAIRREQRMRPEVRGRFLREARILSQLDHPNICRIYDYVEGTERDFLVLELIEGESLAKAIRRGLDGPRRLEIAERVAAALAAAHAKGVVHRDLKPQNVMLAESGEVKVLDFGIALSVGTDGAEAPPGAGPWPSPDAAAATPPVGESETTSPGAAADPFGEPEAGATVVQGPVPLGSRRGRARATGEAAGEPPGGEAGEVAADEPGSGSTGLPSAGEPERGTAGAAAAGPPGNPSAAAAAGPASDSSATAAAGPPHHPSAAAAVEPPPDAADGSLDARSFTVRGTLVGSPGYLSPEQARGHPATTASDMYAFGLLLQELFTGEPAQPPDLAVAELVHRARRAERRPLTGVRSDVAALVSRLLEAAPAARPTAVEALARLRWIRDRPRRRLVRAAVAAVVLVLVLGGVKYTLDLKAARDVAERHRAQADDLIGFMLGDLRDKLADVGRLELLDDVGDKALDYFESLPVEDRTDDELFRRSQALRQIGEVRIAQGDLPAAMEAFEESGELAEELVGRDARRGEWLLGLGHSHFWKGNVHWLQGDLRAARERFESYGEVTDRLIALEPAKTKWRVERGYADTNLAAVHEALGEGDAAFAALTHSLEIKEDLLRRDPDDAEFRRSLATGLSWQGSMLVARGDLAGAARSFAREREMRRALLADDPENADARFHLATNASHTGGLALLRGDLAGGRQALAEARDLYRALVRHDPANSDWRRDLAVAHLQLADLELLAGDPATASRSLADGEEILRALVAQDPSNGNWQRVLARARNLRARAALATGRLAEAGAAAREAQASLEALRAAAPAQGRVLRELAASHLVLGQALAAGGDAGAARASWRRADEILAAHPADAEPLEVLALRAAVLLHLGRTAEAAALVRQLTASGYARPDLLRWSTQHGLPPVASEVAARPR